MIMRDFRSFLATEENKRDAKSIVILQEDSTHIQLACNESSNSLIAVNLRVAMVG